MQAMEEASSPLSLPQTLKEHPQASPKPYKKSFVSSLIDATSFKSPSFREDTYVISKLKSPEAKALYELKKKLSSSSNESASMWGVSLLSGDERADVILLKFLRARDFKVSEAFTMLKKCLTWRKEFGAENISDDDLAFKELEGVVAYMYACDRESHPDQSFLDFKPGGVNSIIQVTDLKDMPKRELKVASTQILSLFQDNYPEMVARKIFINVPWYFTMLYSMFSPFLTQRTKSKFVISKEGNAAETLYKFIKPENVPIQYGGLGRPNELEDGPPKPASEFNVRGGEKVNLEIDGIECGATITWDIVVGGWEVEYSAEFIPIMEGSYTIAIEKPKRIDTLEEPIHNSFLLEKLVRWFSQLIIQVLGERRLLLIDILYANRYTKHN
ncbi:hypothetical protein IFM89_036578 [Coptis chinensis]|uniref:CRAL-TRIO domain-containing protein n=1 Tax=Coptis chinensis TaxID=261450 RepID=A0A835HHE6_9MAGN|nr:hypothetical protein IFM89_036578 [Coptis chinensis]